MTHGIVQKLFHYPIKGLSAQPLDTVQLAKGEGFPMDRAFGLARPNSGFDPENPKPLPKTKFVVLARDAGLAKLTTHYDPADETLTIFTDGHEVIYNLTNPDQKECVANDIAHHLAFSQDERPTLYSAAPHKFTDVSVVSPEMMNAISLVNLDSVAEFGAKIGTKISAARFRANITFSGIAPFAELDWVDRDITIGATRLKIVRRTKRCPATEVNLETAMRDLNVPKLLRDHYDHADMGVYAQVVTGGHIQAGDVLNLA